MAARTKAQLIDAMAESLKPAETPAQVELAEVETKIFGKNVLRDAAGVPMERGHGSNFQKLRHADRSHYLTLAATAGADQIHQIATSLADLSAKVMADQKGARAAAEKAVEEAAIAEVNAAAAADEIRKLTHEVASLKRENLMLTAELAKVKKD